jgi:hypothetical protein
MICFLVLIDKLLFVDTSLISCSNITRRAFVKQVL